MRRRRPGERGALLIMLLAALLLLMLAMSAVLLAFERQFQAQRRTYLEGVVRDLAESGLEYERYLIILNQEAPAMSPDRIEVGEFFGLEGWFTAWTETDQEHEEDARVVSQGELLGADGEPEFKFTLEAELKRDPNGEWAVIYVIQTEGE